MNKIWLCLAVYTNIRLNEKEMYRIRDIKKTENEAMEWLRCNIKYDTSHTNNKQIPEHYMIRQVNLSKPSNDILDLV